MLALEIVPKSVLPKKYYILKSRNIRKRDLESNGKYIVNVICDNFLYIMCLSQRRINHIVLCY